MQAEYYGVKVNAGVKINFLMMTDYEETIPFIIGCPTRQRGYCPNYRLLHLRQEVQLLRSHDLGRNGYYDQKPIAD